MKIHLIYIAIIAMVLMMTCNGNKSGTEITLKTKEVKGAFRIDTITVHDIIKLPTVTYRNGKTIYKTVIDSIDYAIIAKATKLVDSFKKQNDSIKLAMFVSRSTPMDFKKTFENDTIKINMFGKYSGELYGIGLDYTIKPQTVKAQLKQYLLLGGVEIGSNQLLNEFKAKGNLMYLSPRKTLYSLSVDNDKVIYFGVGKKIFEINKVN